MLEHACTSFPLPTEQLVVALFLTLFDPAHAPAPNLPRSAATMLRNFFPFKDCILTSFSLRNSAHSPRSLHGYLFLTAMMVVQSSSSSNDATSSSSSPTHSPPSGTAGSGSSPSYSNALDSRASRETSPSSGAAGSESSSPEVNIEPTDTMARSSRPRQRDTRSNGRRVQDMQPPGLVMSSGMGSSGSDILRASASSSFTASTTTSPTASGSSPEGTRTASGLETSSASSPSPNGDRPRPCSTLFLTNLNLLATETDLVNLFERRDGFRRLRFQLNAEGVPICFVDFDSEETSGSARDKLQGYLLHRTPLRVEFAKQKMKRPRKRSR